MATEFEAIDISGVPELARIAEEVRKTKTRRVLRHRREDIAVVVPVASVRRAKRTKTKGDFEAFLGSAGSWKDIDTDKLISDIYESRRGSYRPPVEL